MTDTPEHAKNRRFLQLADDSLEMLQALSKDSNAMALFFFLARCMRDRSNTLVASAPTLMHFTGLNRNSLFRAVRALKERRIIDVRKSGTTNIYCMNAKVVWRWGANEKWHAAFHTLALVTQDEQHESIERLRKQDLHRTGFVTAKPRDVDIDSDDAMPSIPECEEFESNEMKPGKYQETA